MFNTMKQKFEISENGIKLLKEFEGEILKGYLDAVGLLTVGVGHLVLAGEPYKLGQKITAEESNNLLKKDLDRFENFLNSVIKVQINQNQFDALLSLCFNIGQRNFQNSSVLRKLNAGNYAAAAAAFKLWNKARKNGRLIVLKGLVRRRAAEMELFLKK